MLKKIQAQIIEKKHQLIVLFDQAMVSGVNFLVAILITRFLGLEEFGVFATAWMLVLFFSSIQQAIVIAPIYTLSAQQKDIFSFLGQALNLQLLFSVIASILSLITISIVFHFNNEWYREGVLFSLPITIALFLLQDFFRRKFFVENSGSTVFLSDLITYALQPIIIITLFYLNLLSINSFLTSISFCMLLVSLIHFLRMEKQKLNQHTILVFNQFWQFSKHLFFTSILQWFSGNYFIVFATGVLGPLAIGIIRIAQNLMGVLHILFLTLENLIPIEASKILKRKGKIPTLHFFKQMTIKTGAITGITLILMSAFSSIIIKTIYGPEYLKYNYVIVGFSIIYIFIFLGTIMRFIIRTFEENRIVLENYIITGIFSLLSASYLITNYQLNGVLIGLALVQVISLIYTLIRLSIQLKTK